MLEFAKECPPNEKLWKAITENADIHVEEGYTLQQVRLTIFLMLLKDFKDLDTVNKSIKNKKLKSLMALANIPKVPDILNFDNIEELIYAYALSVELNVPSELFLHTVLNLDKALILEERDKHNPLSSYTAIKLFGLPDDCFPFKPSDTGDEYVVSNKQDMINNMLDRLHLQYDTPTEIHDLRVLTVDLPKYVLKESARPNVNENQDSGTNTSTTLSWDDIQVGTVLVCIVDDSAHRTIGNHYKITEIDGKGVWVTDDSKNNYCANLEKRKKEFAIVSHPVNKEHTWESSIGTIRVGSIVECISPAGKRSIGNSYSIADIHSNGASVYVTNDNASSTPACTINELKKYFTLKEF